VDWHETTTFSITCRWYRKRQFFSARQRALTCASTCFVEAAQMARFVAVVPRCVPFVMGQLSPVTGRGFADLARFEYARRRLRHMLKIMKGAIGTYSRWCTSTTRSNSVAPRSPP